MSKVTSIGYMFAANDSLRLINLSGWNTPKISNNTHATFGLYYINSNNKLTSITLGENTKLVDNDSMLYGNWKNGNQTLSESQLLDGNSHPVTRIHQ